MADDIESTLSAAGCPIRIESGTLLSDTVKFRAALSPGTRPSGVKAALAPARVSLSGGGLVIEVARPDGGATVDTFLDGLKDPPPHTAALGIAQDGAPLLVNLESEAGAHVLVEGDGAADLVGVMIESLRRWNTPDALRVEPVNGQMDTLARGVARGRESRLPVLVALADQDGDALREVLRGGPALAVHVILTATNVDADTRALFPCRVRGLGNRTFSVDAPDWQGEFRLPRHGGNEEVVIEILYSQSKAARHVPDRPDVAPVTLGREWR